MLATRMGSSEGSAGWLYLDADQNQWGPFQMAQLQELFNGKYITGATYLWAEGRAEWAPLSSIPELHTNLTNAAQPSSAPPQKPSNRTQTSQGVQSKPETTPPDVDDELEKWKREVEAAEEEVKRKKKGYVEPEPVPGGESDRPATPPEDEQEFTDDDGTVYVWNKGRKAWVPKDGLKEYNPDEMVFVPDEEVIPDLPPVLDTGGEDSPDEDTAPQVGAKRKADGGDGPQKAKTDASESDGADGAAKKKGEPQKQPEGWFELKVNTSVYVTGLPDDVNMEEIVDVFQKCGVIKIDPETQKPRVKIYRDRNTQVPKGDGLVTYLKEPSVDLAIQLLDGALFRPDSAGTMTVSRAKFEQKGEAFVKKQAPANKRKKAKMQKFEQKNLGWGGFDDKAPVASMTVILKYMFHPEDFDDDPSVLPELEADVAAECSKLGPVERLKVYDKNPQGVISVKFKDKESGLKCITVMNGRWFGGRQIAAAEHDGVTNYATVRESAEEEQARLEKFARELEAS